MVPPPRPPHSALIEGGGCALAGVSSVWLAFTVAGLSAPVGLFVCSFLLSAMLYAVISYRRHGLLVMKDRLATLVVWTGALTALGALVAVIGFVVFKGAPVVFADFPHFLTADFSQAGGSASVTAAGAGAAIVGTIEQVAIATLLTVPIAILTATYLVESQQSSRPHRPQRRRRHDRDPVDHRRFVLVPDLGRSAQELPLRQIRPGRSDWPSACSCSHSSRGLHSR